MFESGFVDMCRRNIVSAEIEHVPYNSEIYSTFRANLRPFSDAVQVSEDMEMTEEKRRQVEEEVERFLRGEGSEVTGCDVGLEQSKPATVRKNVTYIVCAVIVNDKVPGSHGLKLIKLIK